MRRRRRRARAAAAAATATRRLVEWRTGAGGEARVPPGGDWPSASAPPPPRGRSSRLLYRRSARVLAVALDPPRARGGDGPRGCAGHTNHRPARPHAQCPRARARLEARLEQARHITLHHLTHHGGIIYDIIYCSPRSTSGTSSSHMTSRMSYHAWPHAPLASKHVWNEPTSCAPRGSARCLRRSIVVETCWTWRGRSRGRESHRRQRP